MLFYNNCDTKYNKQQRDSILLKNNFSERERLYYRYHLLYAADINNSIKQM